MPQIGIRVHQMLHTRIQDAAEDSNVSISDFVRQAVEHVLNGCLTPSNGTHDKLVANLESQVQEKDEQIRELHQLLAVQSKTTAALTEQLDTSRQMIEDMRRRKTPWFKRTFRWT